MTVRDRPGTYLAGGRWLLLLPLIFPFSWATPVEWAPGPEVSSREEFHAGSPRFIYVNHTTITNVTHIAIYLGMILFVACNIMFALMFIEDLSARKPGDNGYGGGGGGGYGSDSGRGHSRRPNIFWRRY